MKIRADVEGWKSERVYSDLGTILGVKCKFINEIGKGTYRRMSLGRD